VFPEDWTVDDLLGKHRFRPYNPLIANTFFRAGYIEAWGRGIEKIKDSCMENGNDMAEYQLRPSEIMVVFHGLHETPHDHQATQDATHEAPQDVDLNTLESSIIEYCAVPRTKKEITNHFGFADEKGFAKRHLKSLLDDNRIVMTIPDKPRSKNQKYVAVKK
jgi:predicted HTH transcriptional regulator